MCAPTGPAGLAGDTGPIGLTLITQAYANANIPEQTVATNAAVTYGTNTTVGITFDRADTFTIITPGIYALSVALNFGAPTPANSYFGISINGSALVAPSTNANETGQISVFRVGTLAAGDTVQVVNGAIGTVTLAESPGVTGSAGHLMFFRIADMGG